MLGAIVQELMAQPIATPATGHLGRPQNSHENSCSHGPCCHQHMGSSPCLFPKVTAGMRVWPWPRTCPGKPSCFPVPTRTPGSPNSLGCQLPWLKPEAWNRQTLGPYSCRGNSRKGWGALRTPLADTSSPPPSCYHPPLRLQADYALDAWPHCQHGWSR